MDNYNAFLVSFDNLSIGAGLNAQISGLKYEKHVYNICSSLKWTDNSNDFCILEEKELAGSSSKNDLVCCFKDFNDLSIEIKKFKTPDWMQMSIIPIITSNSNIIWRSKGNNLIPDSCVRIFESIIGDNPLFIVAPPYLQKKISHDEWKKVRNEFKDHYIPCDENIIATLYRNKGCSYIQISEIGLYHLGEDVCDFGVPYFRCQQRMRVRNKIHKRNPKGNMQASVIASIQPITYPPKSPYSLDSYDKLPKKLTQI